MPLNLSPEAQHVVTVYRKDPRELTVILKLLHIPAWITYLEIILINKEKLMK